MFKGLVFDKDGSLYSVSKYITPFAEHLSMHFDSKDFLKKYHEFREKAIIGENYNIKTLCEQSDGQQLRSAFWVPALIALHYGFNGSFQQEFQNFSQYILNDSSFPLEPKLIDILNETSYKKAIVTNDGDDKLLRKLRINELFDLKYLNAKKDENLTKICEEIESSFLASPAELVFVEDDLGVLEPLKEIGYTTVLRKTRGFNYSPGIVADLILEDELTQLANFMK